MPVSASSTDFLVSVAQLARLLRLLERVIGLLEHVAVLFVDRLAQLVAICSGSISRLPSPAAMCRASRNSGRGRSLSVMRTPQAAAVIAAEASRRVRRILVSFSRFALPHHCGADRSAEPKAGVQPGQEV
jgi:hypothetical protein